MIISVCVVAYNEQKVLPDLLGCVGGRGGGGGVDS